MATGLRNLNIQATVNGTSVEFTNGISNDSLSVSAIVNGNTYDVASGASFQDLTDKIKFGMRTVRMPQNVCNNLTDVIFTVNSDHELGQLGSYVIGYWLEQPQGSVEPFAWYGYDFTDVLNLFRYPVEKMVYNRQTLQPELQTVQELPPFVIEINGTTATVTIDVTNHTFAANTEIDLDPVAITGSTSRVDNANGTDSVNVTVPVGASLAVVSCLFWYYDVLTMSAISLGGSSILANYINGSQGGSYSSAWSWYQINPSSGTQALAWTASDDFASGATFFITYFSGSDTSAPIRDSDAAFVGNGDPLTTAAFDSDTTDIVYLVVSAANTIDLDVSSQTSIIETNYNGNEDACGYKDGVSGTTTVTADFTTNTNATLIGMSIKAGGAATTPIEVTVEDSIYRNTYETA